MPGSPEGVASALNLDAGVGRASPDHGVHVLLAHGGFDERGSVLRGGRPEEPAFRIAGQLGFPDILLQHFV
jgi:hypothetical protein